MFNFETPCIIVGNAVYYIEETRLEVVIVEVRELRLQTGLSQSKFAKMFDVPVSTLKDWEQERRTPPAYVIKMMRTILEYKGMIISQSYVEACEACKD